MINTISYCTTCKNRLWQLKKTLTDNIKSINLIHGVDLVLLDYHSTDGLYNYINDNFIEQIYSGKLKYYKLTSDAPYFDMSYAKNIVHRLATHQVLFNLDADNYVGSTIEELQNLQLNRILVPRMIENTDTGRCGRIGVHRSVFNEMRGYDEKIKGMGGDDGDFIFRATLMRMNLEISKDLSIPIPNSIQDKFRFTDPSIKIMNARSNLNIDINKNGYGIATLIDFFGNTLNLK